MDESNIGLHLCNLHWFVYQQKYTAWQVARVYTPNIRKNNQIYFEIHSTGIIIGRKITLQADENIL